MMGQTKAKTGRAKTKPKTARVVAMPRPEPPKEPMPSETVFIMKTWKGKPLYQCRECPFNVVDDERAFWLHYAQNHTPKTNSPGSSGLIGPDGKPL